MNPKILIPHPDNNDILSFKKTVDHMNKAIHDLYKKVKPQPIIQAVSGQNGLFAWVKNIDFTTSSTSLVDITGLSVRLEAYSIYQFNVHLLANSNTTAGSNYGINFSAAGATLAASILGRWTANTDRWDNRLIAFNTAASIASFTGTSNSSGAIELKGIVVVGANAGDLTIQCQKLTSGTTIVYMYSFLEAILRGKVI